MIDRSRDGGKATAVDRGPARAEVCGALCGSAWFLAKRILWQTFVRWQWVRELSRMTWEEVRDLGRSRTVAILPVGAIEAHGPHLPLETDVIIANAMARAAGPRLDAHGLTPLLLPALVYTAAPFAAGFAGTLSVEPAAVTGQIVSLASTLAAQGMVALAIANAHLDPAHILSLRTAGESVHAEGRIAWAFPDLTRRRWAERLTEEFRSGACHAGRFETSIVLATRPDFVREPLRAALEAVPRSLTVAIREGKGTFEEAGGRRAYFGDPSAATAAEGEQTIAELGRILEESVLEALEEAESNG